jgi:peptidoglycan hydrolase-like protein with peptidoglycan-binding domain
VAEYEHNSKMFGYISLDDLEGVQIALTKLGYDPGKADGLDGPKTKAAVKKFQVATSIRVDGIAGPETKGELQALLAKKVEADQPVA